MKLSNALASAKSIKLGDHLDTLTDYHANGSYEILKKHVELFDEKKYAAMIRTTNFEKEEFTQDIKWISKDAYEFLKKTKVKHGDIIMNKIANAGTVYRMPTMSTPVSLAMNLFLIRTNESKLNQTYAYYYLKQNEPYIKTFANGTATKTITKDAVRGLDILAPGIELQELIARVLSSFDDLIRVNKLRIVEYENTLALLYSNWLQALLSTSTDNTKQKLVDYVDFVRGIEPGSRNYMMEASEETVPFLRVGDLSKQSSEIFVEKSTKDIKIIEPQDIAMTFDGSIGAVKTGLFGAYSTGIRKVVIKDNTLTPAYIYALLKSDNLQRQVAAHARGTTIKHASTAIPHLEFNLPGKNHLDSFNNVAEPILEQIRAISNVNEQTRVAKDIVAKAVFVGVTE